MSQVPHRVTESIQPSCVCAAFSHELNLSMGQSGFTIYRRYKPEPQATEMLKVLSD